MSTSQTTRERQRRLLEDIANRANSAYERIRTAALELSGADSLLYLGVEHVKHIEAEFAQAMHHLTGARFTLEILITKHTDSGEEA